MTIVDSRGRVFGVMNLIDALLAGVVILLLPMGFLTYRVFHTPDPVIEAVTPVEQPPGPHRRIQVTGKNFRPYLHAVVNNAGEPLAVVGQRPENTEGTLLLESASTIEIQLPSGLPSGAYDLYLFDEARQVAAKAQAFRLAPLALAKLRATVRFVAPASVVALIRAGDVDLRRGSGTDSAEAKAVVESVGITSKVATWLALSQVDRQSAAASGGVVALTGSGDAVDVRVLYPAKQDSNGVWMYHDQTIRPGDLVSFETARYSIRGLVTAVDTADGRSTGQ